jgi:hypothetical protein
MRLEKKTSCVMSNNLLLGFVVRHATEMDITSTGSIKIMVI